MKKVESLPAAAEVIRATMFAKTWGADPKRKRGRNATTDPNIRNGNRSSDSNRHKSGAGRRQ